jgi:RsiW-degrading membrane proteinase PrsW (M82 family)
VAEQALPVPRSRSGIGVLIVVGVAIAAAAAVGSWAIYLELNDAIGRGAFLYAVLFAFAPVIPLAGLLVWLDRLRPEPWLLLVVALLWGAVGATYLSLQANTWMAAQVGDVNGASARSAVFVAPWVEEVTKGVIVFAIVWWRRHDFNAVMAGVVYAGLAGIGCAFTENILYYGQLYQSAIDAQAGQKVALDAVRDLFLYRGVAAPFIHPMFTILIGIGVGVAVRSAHVGARILTPVAGFCGAVLLHMAYNAAASFAVSNALTAVYVAVLLPAIALLVASVLAVRRYERRLIAARLRDYTAFGWLDERQIEYIAGARGRRRARRFARSLGREHRDRLRLFQQTGVDLGALRDRLVRGVAGPAELAREKDLIGVLRALRHRVVLPDGVGGSRADLQRAASSW